MAVVAFGKALAVRDDGAMLLAGGVRGRALWTESANEKPLLLRRWVSARTSVDGGDGAYGALLHAEGALVLTRAGGMSALDREQDATLPSCRASPVGERGRGYIDAGVRLGRMLSDTTAVLGGRRMQHVWLQDDGTSTVDTFFAGATSVCAMVVARGGATVAGTLGGALLRWDEGADRLGASVPEAHPGVPRPDRGEDADRHDLHVCLRDHGLRGLAALRDGRVAAAGEQHLVLWDHRERRLEAVEMKPPFVGAHRACAALDGMAVALVDANRALWLWDVRSRTLGAAPVLPGEEVVEMSPDMQGRVLVATKQGARRLDNDMQIAYVSAEPCISVRASASGEHIVVHTGTEVHRNHVDPKTNVVRRKERVVTV